MKIKQINDLKRKHNALLKEGQELFARIEELTPEMMAIRKTLREVEGDDYDEIPVIFGSGYWIDEDEGRLEGS